MQPAGGVAGSNDRGNPVFAGHQGSVRGQGAAVGDNGSGTREQRCPCRRGSLGDEHIAVGETGEVVWAVHDVDRTGGASGGCGLPDECTLRNLVSAARDLDGTVDDVADEPRRSAESQRRGQPPLTLPQVAPVAELDDPAAVASEGGCQLVAGAEMNVVGRVDGADARQVFT